MPIVEEGSNFPTVLGRFNYPHTIIRDRPIAQQAMALVRGESPIHLAQTFRAQVQRSPLLIKMKRARMERALKRKKLLRGSRLQGLRTQLPRLSGGANIPQPYRRPMQWPTTRAIADLPATIGDVRPTGPESTIRGSLSVII